MRLCIGLELKLGVEDRVDIARVEVMNKVRFEVRIGVRVKAIDRA